MFRLLFSVCRLCHPYISESEVKCCPDMQFDGGIIPTYLCQSVRPRFGLATFLIFYEYYYVCRVMTTENIHTRQTASFIKIQTVSRCQPGLHMDSLFHGGMTVV